LVRLQSGGEGIEIAAVLRFGRGQDGVFSCQVVAEGMKELFKAARADLVKDFGLSEEFEVHTFILSLAKVVGHPLSKVKINSKERAAGSKEQRAWSMEHGAGAVLQCFGFSVLRWAAHSSHAFAVGPSSGTSSSKRSLQRAKKWAGIF